METPTSITANIAKTDQDIQGEFAVLGRLFTWNAKSSKPTLDNFGKLNIYYDVRPFVETAVILNKPGEENLEVTKEYLLENLNNDTYINANYIKSPFQESGNKGLIIAT